MIRTFIAIELKDKDTIQEIIAFSRRLKLNQPKIKLVESKNLHMTVKFLGNIPESLAPEIYRILEEEINDAMFQRTTHEYKLHGVGQFNKFSVIWVKLIGDIQFLQTIKDKIENSLFERLKIPPDKRKEFKPHLTIGRLRSKNINYKNYDTFKNLINENKASEFGTFCIKEVKLKKSELTPKGPIYSDLVY